MKIISPWPVFTASLLIICLVHSTVYGQSVSGVELEIGPTGSNQATGSNKYNGAIGEQNSITAYHSLAVGSGNSVAGQNSAAVGSNNLLYGSEGSFIAGCYNHIYSYEPSFIFGSGNYVEGAFCVAFGLGNFMFASGDSSPYLCTAFGSYNYMADTAVRGFAAGTNNYIDGSWNSAGPISVENASVLGRGLINDSSDSTIVGRYNNSLGFNSTLLFAVGNGNDSTHRSNALEVYADGSIIMSRQGDILMGEFGVPEP